MQVTQPSVVRSVRFASLSKQEPAPGPGDHRSGRLSAPRPTQKRHTKPIYCGKRGGCFTAPGRARAVALLHRRDDLRAPGRI
jgi:hypothetical protein